MIKGNNKNKGITLIALVITIIVMLILVAVTISMAVNGGLFEYAGKAVGDTNNAIQEEQELANGSIKVDGKWYASIDDYIKGKVELPEGIKVGDYVNYTPTTGTYKVADGQYGSGYTTDAGYQSFTTETGENALQWRILSIDEKTGEIELVSATAAQADTPLYLQGADGYNHAVDILNDLCEALYSNENGAIARSINVEDINSKTTYDYTKYEGDYLNYGDKKQLSTYGTEKMIYPNLYSQEIGYGSANIFNNTGLKGSTGLNDGETDENGVSTYRTVTGSTDGNVAGTDPYITYTYYSYKVEDFLDANLGINKVPEGLLYIGKSFWTASRCTYALSYQAYFFVHYMNSSGELAYLNLFVSNGQPYDTMRSVRPVVSLSSNAKLVKDETNSTEDTTYWNIEY